MKKIHIVIIIITALAITGAYVTLPAETYTAPDPPLIIEKTDIEKLTDYIAETYTILEEKEILYKEATENYTTALENYETALESFNLYTK